MRPSTRPRAAAPMLLAMIFAQAVPVAAQTPTMPSTLRYGSGLLDIPVASVLPHMTMTGTLSGFFMNLDRRVQIDEAGNVVGYAPASNRFYTDGSLAFGLFDRAEVGLSLQSFQDEEEGGNLWGIFGRVRLFEPVDQGLGLAVGGRYLTAPSYGDGVEYAPGRLGFPDRRLRRRYAGSDVEVGSNLSLYAVTTAYLRGYDGGFLPENDLTFSLGYGGGMFKAGGAVPFYGPDSANGWFFGSSAHIALGERSLLALMAEYNGFDVNLGAQVDWSGLRAGVHYLAANHPRPSGGYASEYHRPKLGFLASIAVCADLPGFRCRPRTMRRTEPDTIFIPPPPPDTVIVAGAAAGPPPGVEASLCLSTGQNVPIRVTEAGDTLVVGREAAESADPDAAARSWASIEALRPVVAFAGSYAGDAFWYRGGDPIQFEGSTFGPAPDTFPVDCQQILRVGVFQGVPIFADRAAERPLVMIFVPERPGVWRRYERGRGR